MIYILLLVGVVLLLSAYAGISGAPWVPAFHRDLHKVLDDTQLQPGQLCIELGSGDGRLLQAAAKRGAHVIGYEINPLLFLICWLRLMPYRKHSKIYLKSLWGADLSKADVVLTFLVPRTMPKLYKKAVKEMKPGALLVSYIFAVPDAKPLISRHHWFVYRIKKSR
ncbi:MAG: hypothetical protein KIH63_002895 [Candidatus Saccharibacteria bacterium]|nr:hypothetical protein [Candidatus Saccharibacteria bacterium]